MNEINYIPLENHGHPGTFSYNWFYYTSAIKGILRKHRLEFKTPRYGRDSNFIYLESTKRRWHRLYNVPENVYVPFTVYGYSGAVGMMRILKELGVNFRHLLHLKSEIRIFGEMKAGDSYVVDFEFADVMRIKADKAAIIGTVKVKKNGTVLLEVRDHFVIKEVPKPDLEKLKFDETGQFKGITRIPAKPMEGALVRELFIEKHYARDYGSASGDKNIVHTTPLTSRLFGYRRPFIQGLCTANLILSKLSMDGVNLSYFSIIFCRPVYLRSTVFLNYTGSEYRLMDRKGRVLCFGNIKKQ
ncbi:MAG TPA: MaoC/PaaZ C-terminal domain-containing protein [Spirochaetota bacterium]|nr:MaoC/PaaZ C-terminal domain-containing protein [Spirochaetota bacterium]HPS85713.1 MaoC/PaaZ C-terminal domain-containing protein [Spirochaetota bacterium]